MGRLTYGNAAEPLEVEDELLAHLRMVTMTKLRRNESFALTVPGGDGVAETLWIHAAIPLRFAMAEGLGLRRPLLTAMMDAANSSGGLDLTRSEFRPRSAEYRHLRAMSA